jgi:hypothetical protein
MNDYSVKVDGFVAGDSVSFEFGGNRACHVTLEKIKDWLDVTEISGCPEGCSLCDCSYFYEAAK